ncbi:hypothetical protein L211DRAFT_82125 [Terfezia boudieri ATCC MYA-4762]|uniref:Mog1p/PsbP-like protein n=1 Tax=Terfezia boudieri ATCC MYA-4762 TaxID=1051890 RepID=A0A3N4LUT6_9PEZI|nr:hypothetical protein L211DRAFT_82125 [Terfezia boudieri ATCC MYA-4762]
MQLILGSSESHSNPYISTSDLSPSFLAKFRPQLLQRTKADPTRKCSRGQMTGEFTKTDLFGGAIVAEIPKIFNDASIIIDILQHVPLPDIDACKEHFEDVIGGQERSLGKIFQIEPTNEFTMIGPSIPTYIIHGTVSSPYHVAPPRTDPSYLDAQKALPYTIILMVVFRLEALDTDFVVTVNCPITEQADSIIEKRVWHPAYDHPAYDHSPDGTDKTGAPVVDNAVTLLKSVAGTLEVRDWGLFSPQD